MKLFRFRGLLAAGLVVAAAVAGVGAVLDRPTVNAVNEPVFTYMGRYTTGLADPANEVSSGEVVAYENKRMYVTNAAAARLDIVDIDKNGQPKPFKNVDLKPFFPTDHDGDPDTATELTSVAVKNGIVAAALKADDKVSPGKVVFLNRDGHFLADVTVGSLPDMVTFSTYGLRLLVANEGEPNWYGANDDTGVAGTDPEGTVTIVSVLPYIAGYWFGWSPAGTVKTVSFADFNVGGPRNAELPAGVRIFGPGASVAQDLEPEYISVGPDLVTAYVTLQENNAVAAVNILTGKVVKIFALGTKDHNLPGNGIDGSDQDGSGNIQNLKVNGFYMPDAIDSFRSGPQTYFVTANEGDAREYEDGSINVVEPIRLSSGSYTADASIVPNPETIVPRLNVTRFSGNTDADPEFEVIHSFGARSFSIWNAATGAQVFDSGDQFEQHIKSLGPAVPFNINNNSVTADNRSDDKGPEPEAITIGKVRGRTYAFIGLERQGGLMVYDITNPATSTFVTYITSRDYTQPAAPDAGPEILVFIDGTESPTKKPLLLISNEISGTVNIVAID